jgi:hypothetical protein
MDEKQLCEAESLYMDNKFGKHPEQARVVAKGAREAAARLGNSGGSLKTIGRLCRLADRLERLR